MLKTEDRGHTYEWAEYSPPPVIGESVVDDPPLVMGGQGRSDEDATATAKAIVWMLLLVCSLTAWGGAVWLVMRLLGTVGVI